MTDHPPASPSQPGSTPDEQPLICGCGGEPGGSTFGCSAECMQPDERPEPWWAGTGSRRFRVGRTRWQVYVDLGDQWIGRFAPEARPERYYVFPPCVVWKHNPKGWQP